MSLLVIETASAPGSFLLKNGPDSLLHEFGGPAESGRSLVPLIKQKISELGAEVGSINEVAVATGPGSFTGIRIGLATAKTIAYANQAKIVGVNALACIAMTAKLTNAWTSGALTAVMNAYRKQLFIATFDFESMDQQLLCADERTKVISIDEMDVELKTESHLCGPGLKAIPANTIADFKMIDLSVAEYSTGAERIARLRFDADDCDDAIGLLPNYFRGSAAEEKLPKTAANS